MKHLLVSIIIPCYNHEKYVTLALNSVIQDTYQDKEIIIINDGSTDKSDTIINEWITHNKHSITITYINRENRGLCKTLNELVKTAKGKYLVVLASDDALYGNTIADRVRMLEEAEDNGKLVLIGDALVMDGDSNISTKSSMEMNKGNKAKFDTDDGILEEMILKPSTVGAISLINKSIYDIIGYYPEDLFLEDWFFYQRAAALKAIIFWNKPVSLYRVHTSNMSGSNISLKKRLTIFKAVRTSVYRNLTWFPSAYFKYIGVKKLIELQINILKLTIKGFITK